MIEKFGKHISVEQGLNSRLVIFLRQQKEDVTLKTHVYQYLFKIRNQFLSVFMKDIPRMTSSFLKIVAKVLRAVLACGPTFRRVIAWTPKCVHFYESDRMMDNR